MAVVLLIVLSRRLIVNKVHRFLTYSVLILSFYFQSFIFSQRVFISVKSFDFSGVEPYFADIIVNEIKSKINQSSFHNLVPPQKREDDLIQEHIGLDGKFHIKPIHMGHLFGNYKLIIGRLERFSDQYLLTAKLINANTGIKEAHFSISGAFGNLKSDGVDQLISEFASAISKNSLR